MIKPTLAPYKYHALMCCGNSCGENLPLFNYLKEKVAEAGLAAGDLNRVRVNRAGCLEVCMEGLASEDSAKRRAAAWALFEMGPAAAPATELLAEQLEDPEVRMPALRALEAIGADAYPAVPVPPPRSVNPP